MNYSIHSPISFHLSVFDWYFEPLGTREINTKLKLAFLDSVILVQILDYSDTPASVMAVISEKWGALVEIQTFLITFGSFVANEMIT